MWWLLLLIPAALVVFLAVIFIRAALFRPRPEGERTPTAVTLDEEKMTRDMQELVRCKTVSYREKGLEDEAEFDKFKQTLETLYPAVHSTCEREFLGTRAILYRWKGKSDKDVTVLMSHFDVVPVNEDQWEKPAFDGLIENGELWGRGTLDTKVTLCSIMEAAEQLIGEGFVPENDIYFAFGGDEEIAGEGAPLIVEAFRQRGIHPALVVDEGGAVVEGIFPGVTQPCALIGIGEKGMMDIKMTVRSKGGHASSPPPHTPVGVLAKAVTKVENNPFKGSLSKPAAEMFDTLGRHSTFLYRLIFANLWCFKPVLDSMCKKSGGELNALMRTTCAFTMMKGGKASNVIPPEVSVYGNIRIMGGETPETVLQYLNETIGDSDVKIEKVHGQNPSPYSPTEGAGWDKVTGAIRETWPDALVSPYLMIACSDSRHYAGLADNVYRFSAMALSKEERGFIHGNNERIKLDTLHTAAKFYLRLIKSC